MNLIKAFTRFTAAFLVTAAANASLPVGDSLTLEDLDGTLDPGSAALMAFEVGQGNCVFVSCPNGSKVLIDCGTSKSLNSERGDPSHLKRVSKAEYVIRNLIAIPTLPQKKVYVTTSHKDKDHVNLVSRVLAGFSVERIRVGGSLLQYSSSFGDWSRSNKDMAGNSQPAQEWPNIPKDDNLFNKSPLTDYSCGLSPSDGLYLMSAQAGETPNDVSAVVKLQLGGFKALIMGDAEHLSEKAIMDSFPASIPDSLETTLLIASHHGSSNNANTVTFGARVNPEVVVFSTGSRSGYGHPRCLSVMSYGSAYKKGSLIPPDGFRVYRNVPSHPFTCFYHGTLFSTVETESAMYNTEDTGAVIVIISSDGKWGLWNCPSNELTSCKNSFRKL